MKVAVLKAENDARAAATPDSVKKLTGLGAEVAVETGAGARAGITDQAFEAAGAQTGGIDQVLSGADVVLVVAVPSKERLGKVAAGAKLIGLLGPYENEDRLGDYAHANIDAMAMEFVPRITRAQSMDVLSSQANLAGYKAVIDGAAAYGRAFPMMMTAAGTVPAARVFVMGAGVAGLQAIATARRLGAIVSATDVRFAAKEQVESLGASFVTVDEEAMKAGETQGGYAKEMSADFQKRQAEHVAKHLQKIDVVITTALIPGRPAPKLLSEDAVRGMKEGSIIVDLAAPRGGNVDYQGEGERYTLGPATVLAPHNVLEGLPGEASNLYARNLVNLLTLMTDKEEKRLAVDWNDDIVKAITLTRGGEVVHERYAAPAAEPTPPPAEEPVTGEIEETGDEGKDA